MAPKASINDKIKCKTARATMSESRLEHFSIRLLDCATIFVVSVCVLRCWVAWEFEGTSERFNESTEPTKENI